jgi:hypothetical protein
MIAQPIAQPICRAIAVGVGMSTGGGSAPVGNPLPAFQVGDVTYSHPTGSGGTNYDGTIPSPAVAAATLTTVDVSAPVGDGLLTGTIPIDGLASLVNWYSQGNVGLTGTFDISGCTSLVNLRIGQCSHSGSFSALPASIVNVLAQDNEFTGALPDFAGTSLEEWASRNSQFSTWAGTAFPASLLSVDVSGNALNLATVNALVDAAFAASWGALGQYMDLRGGTNASPSAPQIAKIDAMITAGAFIEYTP